MEVADEREWPGHGKELEQVVQNAARKVGCPVISTALVGQVSDGPWRGKVYGGQSVTANAEGNILAHSKDRDRDITMFQSSVINRSRPCKVRRISRHLTHAA
jgi:hypothetical protein